MSGNLRPEIVERVAWAVCASRSPDEICECRIMGHRQNKDRCDVYLEDAEIAIAAMPLEEIALAGIEAGKQFGRDLQQYDVAENPHPAAIVRKVMEGEG